MVSWLFKGTVPLLLWAKPRSHLLGVISSVLETDGSDSSQLRMNILPTIFLVFFASAAPQRPTCSYHANPAGSPTKNDMSLQVGEMPDSNPGLQVFQPGALPLSHHIPQLSHHIPRWATTSPIEPPHPPIEPPHPPGWILCSKGRTIFPAQKFPLIVNHP